jgi:hypothetical protein
VIPSLRDVLDRLAAYRTRKPVGPWGDCQQFLAVPCVISAYWVEHLWPELMLSAQRALPDREDECRARGCAPRLMEETAPVEMGEDRPRANSSMRAMCSGMSVRS